MRNIIILFSVFFSFIIFGNNIEDLIKEGDILYEQRGDINKAFLALKKYREVLTFQPGNYEALWKTAKTTHYLVDEINSVKEQKKIVDIGVKASKKAIKTDPGRAEGYFWLSVNYAKSGQVRGVLKSLFLISPIKKNMRKVIKINEAYEGGAAYITLGRVYSQVPGLLGGSNRKALENLQKAKKICSTNPLTYLFLAEVFRDRGDLQMAVKTLKELEKMEVDKRWIPETIKKKKEGRELLKKYKLEMLK
ncbi:MAG: TRAP transporter TatT component family protein [Acidobacteriota bacterium]